MSRRYPQATGGEMPKINFLAVFTAAIVSFLVGGLWYSLLFKGAWMRANKFKEEDLMKGNPALIFGLSFVFSLIMAFNLAAFIGAEASLTWGLTAGGLAGAGWVGTAIAVTALFERRSLHYVLINCLYWIVAFVLMGGILGVWH
jgi:hypothetical protein